MARVSGISFLTEYGIRSKNPVRDYFFITIAVTVIKVKRQTFFSIIIIHVKSNELIAVIALLDTGIHTSCKPDLYPFLQYHIYHTAAAVGIIFRGGGSDNLNF